MFTLKINDIAPLLCFGLQWITWFSWLLTIKDHKYFIYENRLFMPTKYNVQFLATKKVPCINAPGFSGIPDPFLASPIGVHSVYSPIFPIPMETPACVHEVI